VIAVLVGIGVYVKKKGTNELETSDDVADLEGGEKMANDRVLLDEKEPSINVTPVDPNGFSLRQGTLSGLADSNEQIWV
jgi:hypothetical protein